MYWTEDRIKQMDLEASRGMYKLPLSSIGVTNCITKHGEWRVPNKDHSQIAAILEQEISKVSDPCGSLHNRQVIFLKCETTAGIQGWILSDRVRFYYPDGRYSGIRLKRLK